MVDSNIHAIASTGGCQPISSDHDVGGAWVAGNFRISIWGIEEDNIVLVQYYMIEASQLKTQATEGRTLDEGSGNGL